ncbi:C4-dicarboxylate ABC transporter permease [Synergistales bacterium]|nr:C4-dicarboxylate ABC transporter permease [Synergistales bacterium]GHV33287.1 C4-dicarboxylate ABC transporter permease [Synergistales bacterium]
MDMLLNGFMAVLMPENLIYLFGGVVIGLVMGAIPGLTATMAIALIIPMTYYITPTQSLIMLLAAYNAGTFGGSMSAILIATPGTPAAAATVADGFALAKQGKAVKAIKAALFASCFGCLFSSVMLVLVAQPVARYALKFGPAEYTVLMVFSLTIIASAAGRSMIKGLIGGCLGLLFGCVGMDAVFTSPRLTFGILKLSSGIDLMVLLIGALAFSELLKQVCNIRKTTNMPHLPAPSCKEDSQFTKDDLKLSWKHWFRSSVIGCVIGALPGLGPALACWVGYDAAKRSAKHPELFGKGAVEGIAGAEAANNAVCGANMIPLLSLGVPGDTGAAVLIGAFLVQGLTPGPLIFSESPQTVYNVYAGLIMCNVVLFFVVMSSYRLFAGVAKLEGSLIYPAVCVFCVVGVYALNRSLVDVWLMLFFAVIGFVLSKFEFPTVTMLIGFILSPIFERNARRALQLSFGEYSVFFRSPLCWAFWAITVISVVTILWGKRKHKTLQDGL